MLASADLTCWVTPKSGPMRPVRTLGDLRKAFLDDLPRQRRHQRHWFAVGRLLEAAMETRGRLDRMLVTDALLMALEVEGWMTRRPAKEPTAASLEPAPELEDDILQMIAA